ncbi:carboxypeptidase M32 [Anaerosalibacter bizertensis]|uniref:carboxypeptidase M32 n=1 Tax=Anaerosalibacter bizertensis TaxID=932217 RepID=UPI001C0ED68C|nr:carboxypeptidase M32 [Anaerosalibacter bizertensis]
MNISDEKKLQKIKEHIRKIEYLKFTNNNLLYWDKVTNMPKKGIGFRSEVMSFLAGELHKLIEDKEFVKLVAYFDSKDPQELDIQTISMIRKIKGNYEYINKIPSKEYRDYIYLIAEAEQVWSKSKRNDDFESVVPYLEKIVEHFKNFTEYWGYEEEPYDALFSFYGAGVNTKMVDEMFQELKGYIVKLLEDISTSKVRINDEIFSGYFNKDAQSKMTIDILNRIGFDFDAGRVDEGEHPTILPNSNKDVRIITSYNEEDFRPAFTTALHGGGQALYEQGISSDLYGTLLAEPSSVVFLEAIARFYENIFGRSKEFWDFYYPIMQGYFPSFKTISKKNFYKALNKVDYSLIRMDADELTYNLHIIIRYEIEKDLINNKLSVKDIPDVWNEKYKEYLGIEPPNHGLGALQDVHWFSGYFGYFPNYILGNLYAAQIYSMIKREIPDYGELVSSGNWDKINDWFKEKIFIHGSIYYPEELIYLVTDENLKVDYFIDYLDEKYRYIYEM